MGCLGVDGDHERGRVGLSGLLGVDGDDERGRVGLSELLESR